MTIPPTPPPEPPSHPIPITIITGFLGSGKTTLLLSLLPQLRAANPSYRLALLKNEFGDVAVDSQLAASSAISGVQELLGGCICCNLVGQLSVALAELRAAVAPDRIVIETSGSAFPATLALEVNRLARETGGAYVLDGVDTSYTARLQARYTDLIVFNKWEGAGERRFDECLDRLGDLELDTPWVKSDRGKSEVEVLSVELKGGEGEGEGVDVAKLLTLLKSAPRDEVYRIKAVLTADGEVKNSDEDVGVQPHSDDAQSQRRFILNWAFGRWTFTPIPSGVKEHESSSESTLRMTMILARYESTKWKKKLEAGNFLELGSGKGELSVTKSS
ncbi:CobW/HypB/UreG, nucleotide-binding domain-containing protein [Schizothecium vesticola]|uniref:CobW/HypB/UreG, nucleotide-binding domain-containing protein n=1 Tax=Schizothecium vesticola TaxID=314040 RepID=A0AA40F6E9_9PEZI|nr:CobW/HypB/UreG, nucleotide-binding domain-containing protein [Schizothecium vesticola]